jgi:hypothetical protein
MPNLILSDDDRAIARTSLRQLMRCPPLRVDDAEKVLTSLARGARITHIGNTPGLPPYWVINLWRQEFPEFDQLCVAASEAGADALAWESLDIADTDGRAPADKALSIGVRDRLGKVLHRKKYDPATRVEVSAGPGQADDLSDDALAAIARRSGAIDGVATAVTLTPSDGDGDGSGE